MEKTEMMKKYEAETGESARDELYSGSMKLYMPTNDYIAWLEANAAAYDRIMSGGKKTPKEVANFFDIAIAEDKEGSWHGFGSTPVIDDIRGVWESFMDYTPEIPSCNIRYTGSWQDSLTLPDGWEEA